MSIKDTLKAGRFAIGSVAGLAAVVALIIFGTASCSKANTEPAVPKESFVTPKVPYEKSIISDPENGCEYLVIVGNNGVHIVPRYQRNANGITEVKCPPEVK